MIIVLRPKATAKQIEHIEKKLKEHGVAVHISKGTERTIIGAIGDEGIIAELPLAAMPGVEKVMPIARLAAMKTSTTPSSNGTLPTIALNYNNTRLPAPYRAS